MKKFKIGILIISILLLVGCSSTKEDVDPSTVQSILESKNYKVYDLTDTVSYASKALYASKLTAIINYVQGIKKYDIQGIFLDECTNVYNEVGSVYEKKTDGGDNWTYLIVTTEEDYYFVGWVNDSYITITASIDQEKTMNALAKELGFK